MRKKPFFAVFLAVATAALMTACGALFFDLASKTPPAGDGYTVTFCLEEGDVFETVKVTPPNKSLAEARNFPDDPEKDGHIFMGWWTEEGGGGNQFTPLNLVDSDMNVYAWWQPTPPFVYYMVTFDGNGGQIEASPRHMPVSAGQLLDRLPGEPENPTFLFTGWWTEKEGGTPFTRNTPIDKDITVYAQWEPINGRVKITFDENGADVKASPQERAADIGETVILPEEPVWNGWVFKEWNTRSNGAGGKFDATTPVTANITRVYAVWDPAPALSYTVTFDPNGGTLKNPGDESRTVTPPEKHVDTMPADPELEHGGEVFAGWYTEKTGGDLFSRISVVEGNMTVYAQWEDKATDEWMVFFDGNGGTGHIPAHFTVEKGKKLGKLPTDPRLDGYAFDGWYTTHTGGDPVTASMPIDGDRIFYARWKPETGTPSDNVTVTFDPNNLRYGLRDGSNWGSNPEKTVNVNPGAMLADPGDPSHKFHIFDGWYTAPTGGIEVSFPQPINEDKIFYAQWTFLLTSAEEVGEYLNLGDYYNNEDGTLEEPVNLPVKIDFEPMTQAGSQWRRMLGFFFGAAAGYVNLDLSDSTVNGNEFNPAYNVTAGKDKIVSLTLPDTATKIADWQNYYDYYYGDNTSFKSLRTVSGKGVTYVGKAAFFQCTLLENIDLPKAETIGEAAFSVCEILEDFYQPEAVTIGSSALFRCTALESISLPKAEIIGSSAFGDCYALESISLPNALTIGEAAFSGCTVLESISLPKAVTIGRDAFKECYALAIVDLPEVVEIDSSENFRGAFYYCTALKSISLPKVERIGDNAFAYCYNLAIVSLPKAETIGFQAFAYCNTLAIVSLPNAETIGREAFSSCTALATLEILKVKSLGDNVFASTGTRDFTVTMGPAAPTVGNYTFNGISSNKNVTVKVPAGATGYADNLPFTVSGSNSDDNWGNAFRGKTYNPPSYTYVLNTNITLTIKEISE
jgi:uncharacterized repeat protein (TIGR02543 family)